MEQNNLALSKSEAIARIRQGEVNTSGYFVPVPLTLKSKVKLYCPHCGRKVPCEKITLFPLYGMVDDKGTDLADVVSGSGCATVAACPACGGRINAGSSRAIKKAWGSLRRLITMLLVVLLVLAIGFGILFTFIKKHICRDLYEDGRTLLLQQDYDAAVTKLEKARNYGNADAAYLLSECYASGLGVSANDSMAEKLFQEALDDGSDLAAWAAAMDEYEVYLESGNVSRLQACIDELKTNPTGPALYQLSLFTRCGIGTTEDTEEADRLLQQAAEAGYVDAICDWAQWLAYEGDFSGALAVLEPYHELDLPDIQAVEGWVYLLNHQTEPGMRMLNGAIERGSRYGNVYMGHIYYNGMVAGYPDDHAMANTYYTAAAEAGSYYGLLGQAFCEAGDDQVRQYEMGEDCFNHGYVEGACVIGYAYKEGRAGKNKNIDDAARYASMAANHDFSPAEILMASIEKERGNMEQCRQYLERAYRHGALMDANAGAKLHLENAGDQFFGPDYID